MSAKEVEDKINVSAFLALLLVVVRRFQTTVVVDAVVVVVQTDGEEG